MCRCETLDTPSIKRVTGTKLVVHKNLLIICLCSIFYNDFQIQIASFNAWISTMHNAFAVDIIVINLR